MKFKSNQTNLYRYKKCEIGLVCPHIFISVILAIRHLRAVIFNMNGWCD